MVERNNRKFYGYIVTKYTQTQSSAEQLANVTNTNQKIMMDIVNDDNDSEELRLHIHRLLHDYSRTHYTTNYVEFTENLVAEV